MNIQKDEKGKLLLTLIKFSNKSQAPVQRINCIVIIQLIKNIWYLMQLLDYPKKMSIAFFFSKKKIVNCHCFLFVSFTQDDKENTVKKNHLQAPTNTLNNTFLNFV